MALAREPVTGVAWSTSLAKQALGSLARWAEETLIAAVFPLSVCGQIKVFSLCSSQHLHCRSIASVERFKRKKEKKAHSKVANLPWRGTGKIPELLGPIVTQKAHSLCFLISAENYRERSLLSQGGIRFSHTLVMQ